MCSFRGTGGFAGAKTENVTRKVKAWVPFKLDSMSPTSRTDPSDTLLKLDNPLLLKKFRFLAFSNLQAKDRCRIHSSC